MDSISKPSPQQQTPASTSSNARTRLSAHKGPRTIDDASRRRRIQRQLENLEKDNFHEDPHAAMVMNKAVPKFDDTPVTSERPKVHRKRQHVGDKMVENATKKGKKLLADINKTRFRKTFAQLLEEEEKVAEIEPDERTYLDVTAPPSRYPPRKFCSVCGLFSKYTCVKCGSRYCSIPCRDTHSDTRCQKMIV